MKKYCVHWLLYNLPIDFKRSYRIRYDYFTHNYFFYRNRGYDVLDCFTVVRTSEKCFRVSYVNLETLKILTFSSRSALRCAMRMYELFIEYG